MKCSDQQVDNAFSWPTAGYCVITYILGVGDRHLDNLLLTKTGELLQSYCIALLLVISKVVIGEFALNTFSK